MVPLVWLAATLHDRPTITKSEVPVAKIVYGVPMYALDKHTRLGREAIRRGLNCERGRPDRRARSPDLEERARGKDNKGRNNQPCKHENCALLCAWDGQLERDREQHTRKNMSRCPRECRQDIGGIKL